MAIGQSMLGACMCGDVLFEARGTPRWTGICHCASCRRATGGALLVAAGFARSQVAFSGDNPARYASSPDVVRLFCASCGTSLAYQSEQWPDDIHLFAEAFNEPEMLTPQFHIFAQDQFSWLHLSDNLPRFKTTPSAGDLLDD